MINIWGIRGIKMTKFSKEFKESLVLKVLGGAKQSIRSVATEAKVGVSSLHQWVQDVKISGGIPAESVNKRSCDWSPAEKFNAVVESLSLKNEEINHYCRGKGIYSSQLAQWKLDFMSDKEITPSSKQVASELKTLRAQNKQLQRELHRKEKALAEASALLLLKKKADLIWEAAEDDLSQ